MGKPSIPFTTEALPFAANAMHATIYELHHAATKAELAGFGHYAAALRTLLDMQLAQISPKTADLALPGTLPVLSVESPKTGLESPKQANPEPTCPRCTSTETRYHPGDCVQYHWCGDCGHKWDFC